jgi:hypothetical protein
MPGRLDNEAITASGVLRFSYRARGLLLVSLASCAALAFVPQVREIFRTLLLDAGAQAGVIAVTAFTLLMLMAGVCVLCWTADALDESRSVRRAFAAACAARRGGRDRVVPGWVGCQADRGRTACRCCRYLCCGSAGPNERAAGDAENRDVAVVYLLARVMAGAPIRAT